MAQTVTSAFKNFNSNIVNLNSSRTVTARASRDWLFGQLNTLDTKDNIFFPKKFTKRHINFGSFARKTKIKELDDIDLMFCLTSDNASYTTSINKDTYFISTVNAGTELQKLSDENVLNSRKVLNKFKISLSNISNYNSANLHSKQEAVTLALKSYEWVFDIVPCFYTDSEIYLIPDGNGNWKPTDPRIDQDRVTNTNKAYSGKLLQLIRTLKYWNRHNSTFTIPSYLFENLIINFVLSMPKLQDWIDFNIKDFFIYLKSAIFNTVIDPKGIQGNLNLFSYSEQLAISQKSDWAYQKAKDAIDAEISKKNQQQAINLWREIFGLNFPTFG